MIKLEHVAMYVHDLEGARQFFTQYFGATCNQKYHNKTTDFQSYFLSFGEGARLEIMHKPNLDDATKTLGRTGLVHLAFTVGSAQAVDALTTRLQADGYPVLSGPRTTGDGYYESCLLALEDNQIEITI